MKSFSFKIPATLLDEEKTPVKNITGVFSFLPFENNIVICFYNILLC